MTPGEKDIGEVTATFPPADDPERPPPSAVSGHKSSRAGNEGTPFLETKEHPQISNASFRKRGRENVFLQMF